MPIQNTRVGYRNETGEDLDIFVEPMPDGTPVIVIRKRQTKQGMGIILPTGVAWEGGLTDKLKGS